MRHTHGDVGGGAPLTHWRVVRQLELFGHHAMDGVHIQPLSEQVSSWILTHGRIPSAELLKAKLVWLRSAQRRNPLVRHSL